MTQEEKQLLLQDLCARLYYGVKVQYDNEIYNIDYISALYEEIKLNIPDNYTVGISEIKPYLRHMSSMTEEEIKEYEKLCIIYDTSGTVLFDINGLNWFNVHHLDYRGLIEKGLAIEAPNGMYNLNSNK